MSDQQNSNCDYVDIGYAIGLLIAVEACGCQSKPWQEAVHKLAEKYFPNGTSYDKWVVNDETE